MTETSETLPPNTDASSVEPFVADGVAIDPSRARRMPRIRTLFVAFIVGLLAALVISGAGLYAYDMAHDGRILHGVRIGGVDVSDLDRDTAAARLQAGLASYGVGKVLINVGILHDTITYAELGRGPAIDALLDQAFAVGRVGTVVDRGIDEVRTATHGEGIAPSVTVDPTMVAAAVADLATREDRDSTDASTVNDGGTFEVVPGKAGRQVDQAAMATAIVAAVSKADAPASVTLDLISTPVAPAVDDARATLAVNGANAMAQDLKIVSGSDSWPIPAATVKSWISFGTVDGQYQPIVDAAGVQTALDPLVKAVARKPKDASFLMGKNGKIVGVTAAVTGRALDVDKSVAAVVSALQARAAGVGSPDGSVQAVVAQSQPKLTTAVAQQSAPLMKQISTWVTYYQSGPHNGFSANISIPAQAISGTVVAPGATFSFWKAVGEVTLAKGYKLGGAIINGHSVEGTTIGGGICSTSTTLFNAALRAGFQMGARKNHYYYIARYPKGLDATVFKSGSVQDMTWTNNTPYPVLIKAFTRPGVVRFTLYSVPTGRTVTISPAVVKNYSPSTTVVENTASLPHGRTKQVEYEAAGFDSWVTVTVRDKSGKVISKRTYYSHYARVVGVILRGI